MSRIANAWRALMGVEPEVRTKTVTKTVIGSATEVTLYVVSEYSNYTIYGPLSVSRTYYTTCELAHKANPGKSVATSKALRVGRDYYIPETKKLEVNSVKVDKPKRAKGAK